MSSFLDKSKICALGDWPAQSLDLDMTEPLWVDMKARLASCRPGNIKTLHDFRGEFGDDFGT